MDEQVEDIFLYTVCNFKAKNCIYLRADLEKDGRSGRSACANFCVFLHMVLKGFCLFLFNFGHFCSFFPHDFSIFCAYFVC